LVHLLDSCGEDYVEAHCAKNCYRYDVDDHCERASMINDCGLLTYRIENISFRNLFSKMLPAMLLLLAWQKKAFPEALLRCLQKNTTIPVSSKQETLEWLYQNTKSIKTAAVEIFGAVIDILGDETSEFNAVTNDMQAFKRSYLGLLEIEWSDSFHDGLHFLSILLMANAIIKERKGPRPFAKAADLIIRIQLGSPATVSSILENAFGKLDVNCEWVQNLNK
jgi:hypothetical protein